MLTGHGNSKENLAKPIDIDFSSNIWYGGINKGLLSHLEGKLKNLADYPSVDARSLQNVIAKYYSLSNDQVCVTNGATEAFYLIAHAFTQKRSLIMCPSFSEYNDASVLYNHAVEYVTFSQLKDLDYVNCDLVWIGNPNNPDGRIISHQFIENLLLSNPKKTFVIDEAYAEVCAEFQSSIELINKYDNLIVVKSMTKQCVIPGLRLGYFLSNEKLTQKIARFRMPWSVNSLAIEAGKYIFNNIDSFAIETKSLLKESQLFQQGIDAISGVEVIESETNYFLCKLQNHSAVDLKEYLIENFGFLIRDAANFEGLDYSYFRVAIQGRENNLQCVNAIKQFVTNE